MQKTFYNSGIGTYAAPSIKSISYTMRVLMSQLDLAFALYDFASYPGDWNIDLLLDDSKGFSSKHIAGYLTTMKTEIEFSYLVSHSMPLKSLGTYSKIKASLVVLTKSALSQP